MPGQSALNKTTPRKAQRAAFDAWLHSLPGAADGMVLSLAGGALTWVTAASAATVTAVDNGNGTLTLTGSGVTDNGNGTFTASDPAVTDNGDGTYTLAA